MRRLLRPTEIHAEFPDVDLSLVFGMQLSASDCILNRKSAGILLTLSTIFSTNSNAYFASAKTGSVLLQRLLAAL